MTSTFNPTQATVMPRTHTHTKTQFKGQSAQKIQSVNKQTDRETDPTDCFTFPSNAVGKNALSGLIADKFPENFTSYQHYLKLPCHA